MASAGHTTSAAARVWAINDIRLNIASHADTRTLSRILRASRTSFHTALSVLYHDIAEDTLIKCSKQWADYDRFVAMQQVVRRITSSKDRTKLAPLLAQYPLLSAWVNHDASMRLSWERLGASDVGNVRGVLVLRPSRDIRLEKRVRIPDLRSIGRGILPPEWTVGWSLDIVGGGPGSLPMSVFDKLRPTSCPTASPFSSTRVTNGDQDVHAINICNYNASDFCHDELSDIHDELSDIVSSIARTGRVRSLDLEESCNMSGVCCFEFIDRLDYDDIRSFESFTCVIGSVDAGNKGVDAAVAQTPLAKRTQVLRHLRFIVLLHPSFGAPDSLPRHLARVTMLAQVMYEIGGDDCTYQVDFRCVTHSRLVDLQSGFAEAIRALRNGGVATPGWRRLESKERVATT